MATALAATVEHEVTITAAQKTKLTKKFRLYAELKAQREIIEAAMDKAKGEIESVRAEIGENTIALEGIGRATYVCGTTSKLDQKKLLAQGVLPSQIEAATVVTPKKPFTKITLPNEKDE